MRTGEEAEGLADVKNVGAQDAGPPGFLDEGEDGQYGKQPDDEAELGATEGAEADAWDFAPVAAGVDEQEESVLLSEESASYRLSRVSLLGQTSFLMFISKLRFLPTQWTMPTSAEAVNQFAEAFTDSERMVAPNSPLNLFREMTLNAYHVNTAKVIGKGYEQYIKGVTDAICDAIGKWSLLTVFAGVQINGPVGMVTPGCVLGPPLLPFILASAPKDTPMQL